MIRLSEFNTLFALSVQVLPPQQLTSTELAGFGTAVVVNLCCVESKCSTSGSRLVDLDIKEIWEPCLK